MNPAPEAWVIEARRESDVRVFECFYGLRSLTEAGCHQVERPDGSMGPASTRSIVRVAAADPERDRLSAIAAGQTNARRLWFSAHTKPASAEVLRALRMFAATVPTGGDIELAKRAFMAGAVWGIETTAARYGHRSGS